MNNSEQQPTPYRGMITLSIMLATIMQTLDSTIANVALPHMQGALSASQDQITWVLTSYIVAAAIATPLNGWLCDRFGKKNVLLVSILGFTLASCLCGVAVSLPEIVLARVLQGISGAALVPLSQTILLDINTRDKQGSAMAIWGMGVMVGPILGPTLGGWLTDSYSWRWVFFINVPIGMLAMYGVWTYIKTLPSKGARKFDMFGFATLSIAIGALQLLLDRGEQNDWFSSIETRIEAAVMVISFSYFIVHTLLTPPEESFFNFRLLKNHHYSTGLLLIFVIGLLLYATRALIPPMLQNLMDYPVATAGLVTAPSGAGTMLAMLLVGRLVTRVDIRLLLFVGFSIAAFSLWQMSQYTIILSESDIVWPGFIQGVGLGLIFVPLSTATFATLPPEMRAEGTAIYSLIRNIGSSIGISLVQTLLVRNTQVVHSGLVENVTPYNSAWRDSTVASIYDLHTQSGLAALDDMITHQASMIGYIDDFWMMFLLTVIAMPLLFLMRVPKRSL
ncbi:MFS transporter [Paramixta manurensis]|uniref:MFS transporter n=1 Tax=Paramixta manurensis TaxID=2740817 RepID=A0A6M8UEC0_9GAMM|nr:MFS transporter [Erwiniaceae bacterium PD-1]